MSPSYRFSGFLIAQLGAAGGTVLSVSTKSSNVQSFKQCKHMNFLSVTLRQSCFSLCSVPQAFFAVIIGAISLGQATPNLENLMTAAGAAGAIFEVINRVGENFTLQS